MDVTEFKQKIAKIYALAKELGNAFGIERCTPDGHLLGAIGQIAAKIGFGLEFGSEKEEHNCIWSDGTRKINVQVRCSGLGQIALRQEPEHLIALEISPQGRIRILFNGPGGIVWNQIRYQKSAAKIRLFKVAPKDSNRSSSKRPITNNL